MQFKDARGAVLEEGTEVYVCRRVLEAAGMGLASGVIVKLDSGLGLATDEKGQVQNAPPVALVQVIIPVQALNNGVVLGIGAAKTAQEVIH